MAITWYEAPIKKITTIAPDVKCFFLDMTDVENFDFKAGQFITLDLPIGEKRLQRWRSYSIASAPNKQNELELCIVKAKDGLGTKFLFENVEVGSILRFKGPDGTFFLPDAIDKDLVFICTGTGLVPFRSMLQDLLHQSKLQHSIHLIFGTRFETGILYQKELNNLKEKMPNFKYDIVLSRENNENYHHGYVHSVYLEDYAQKRENIQFYLCGWSAMIDEAVANLIVTLGYERKQVSYELYG
jgi:ferredoxin-NADP reductase